MIQSGERKKRHPFALNWMTHVFIVPLCPLFSCAHLVYIALNEIIIPQPQQEIDACNILLVCHRLRQDSRCSFRTTREVLFSDVGVLVMAANFTPTGSEAWIDVANKAITIQEKQKHQGYGPIMLTGIFFDASAMIAWTLRSIGLYAGWDHDSWGHESVCIFLGSICLPIVIATKNYFIQSWKHCFIAYYTRSFRYLLRSTLYLSLFLAQSLLLSFTLAVRCFSTPATSPIQATGPIPPLLFHSCDLRYVPCTRGVNTPGVHRTSFKTSSLAGNVDAHLLFFVLCFS